MKRTLILHLLAWGCALGLVGCDKPTSRATAPPARATPSATPAPKDAGEGKDFDAGKLRRKADQAVDAVCDYLNGQDPKLKARFEKFADKLSDKLDKDKGRWREKLEAKRKDLQPRIAELRQQYAQSGEQAKERLSAELSRLEGQDKEVDAKLSELQTMGVEAWRKFKAKLKEDDANAKAEGGKRKAEGTPTPEPYPGGSR